MGKRKKQKYYVVWQGHNPGIYNSWPECQNQIKNFPNAKYKSFENREEAEKAYYSDFRESWGREGSARKRETPDPIKGSIAVDAACSGNPGLMEYRGVRVDNGVELFRKGPFEEGTNNVGEFLALVHALALLKQSEDEETAVYTDSKIAMGWVAKCRANTKLKRSQKNEILFRLIERAEKWLKVNSWKNPIIKWPTEKWGEIPADFGRK